VGWISNRRSAATQQRADDLKIDFLHQDSGSKVVAAESMLTQAGVAWEEVCYIGDDVVDLGMLKRVGLGVAVSNAIEEVRARAAYVTRAAGGRGAVREVVEMILKAKQQWTGLIEHFLA
jgi:3-deoxy-D-manno-octulosonate 8-phosphate phosphatase (KDO 8-P phosphatase)